MFGIGYNAKIVGNRNVDLTMLFDKKNIVGKEIGMTDDPQESLFLGAQYLHIPFARQFYASRTGSNQRIFIQQKDGLVRIVIHSKDIFLASDTFAVVASDREIIAREMIKYDHIKFATLPEGSMMRLDNVVINVATTKDELIYEFLEYLFSYDVLMHHAKKYCILPTMQNVFKDLDQKYIGVPIYIQEVNHLKN